MKHIYILLFLTFFTHTLWAQEIKDSTNIVLVRGSISQGDRWERKIRVYADSLNYYSDKTLPHFITDECFDVTFTASKAADDYESPRWAILERVYNNITLQKIIKTKNKSLDKKCSIKMPFEDSNYKASFRQLAQKRLQQIKGEPQAQLIQ